MATETIQQLYPRPAAHTLKGLYLAHDVRKEEARPFVYANFIQSLDGRIAINNERNRARGVPVDVANGRDWRLYQELSAQADIIILSGTFMQKVAAGFAPDMLLMNNPRYAYLREWRVARGLRPLPDCAIISRSLNFTIPPEVLRGRAIHIFTTYDADASRCNLLLEQGANVHHVGQNNVEGKMMIATLAHRGYNTIYSGAGGTILNLLLRDGVLNRLYLTLAPRLVGGVDYATINDGFEVVPAARLQLNTLYMDTKAFSGDGQLFVSYNVLA